MQEGRSSTAGSEQHLAPRHSRTTHRAAMGMRAEAQCSHFPVVPREAAGTGRPASPELLSSTRQAVACGREAHLTFLHIVPVLLCFQPLGWWLFYSFCIAPIPSCGLLCSPTSSYSWETKR